MTRPEAHPTRPCMLSSPEDRDWNRQLNTRMLNKGQGFVVNRLVAPAVRTIAAERFDQDRLDDFWVFCTVAPLPGQPARNTPVRHPDSLQHALLHQRDVEPREDERRRRVRCPGSAAPGALPSHGTICRGTDPGFLPHRPCHPGLPHRARHLLPRHENGPGRVRRGSRGLRRGERRAQPDRLGAGRIGPSPASALAGFASPIASAAFPSPLLGGILDPGRFLWHSRSASRRWRNA